MPVDLAQRLMYADAVARDDIEAALLRYAKHGVPFLGALLERRPQIRAALESELTRIAGEEAPSIGPDPELVARLPDGLCSQFFGFPIAISPETGAVDVLIANPINTQARDEFGFHLQAPVRLVRGSLRFLADQLATLEGRFAPLSWRVTDSYPPIPLVRLAPKVESAPPPTAMPKTTPGVAPPAQEVTRPTPARPVTPPPAPARPVTPPPAPAPVPPAAAEPLLSGTGFQPALGELAIAESPEQVVEALVIGLSPLCEEVVVLAARGAVLRCRCRADRYGQPEKMTPTEFPETAAGCASSALHQGQFLGSAVEADQLIFSMPSREVSATAVKVANKPALVVCISGFGNAYEATRRADHLARAASDALSRIVLSRKR